VSSRTTTATVARPANPAARQRRDHTGVFAPGTVEQPDLIARAQPQDVLNVPRLVAFYPRPLPAQLGGIHEKEPHGEFPFLDLTDSLLLSTLPVRVVKNKHPPLNAASRPGPPLSITLT